MAKMKDDEIIVEENDNVEKVLDPESIVMQVTEEVIEEDFEVI